MGWAAIGVEEDRCWLLLSRCALSSMPAIRRLVLEHLVTGTLTTTQIAERLGYPTVTVRRALEDLAAHSLVKRDSQGQGKADLLLASDWTLTKWLALASDCPSSS
jgi:transcription initiation factor IIE alpha subunit